VCRGSRKRGRQLWQSNRRQESCRRSIEQKRAHFRFNRGRRTGHRRSAGARARGERWGACAGSRVPRAHEHKAEGRCTISSQDTEESNECICMSAAAGQKRADIAHRHEPDGTGHAWHAHGSTYAHADGRNEPTHSIGKQWGARSAPSHHAAWAWAHGLPAYAQSASQSQPKQQLNHLTT
jgi:hypothetical protein